MMEAPNSGTSPRFHHTSLLISDVPPFHLTPNQSLHQGGLVHTQLQSQIAQDNLTQHQLGQLMQGHHVGHQVQLGQQQMSLASVHQGQMHLGSSEEMLQLVGGENGMDPSQDGNDSLIDDDSDIKVGEKGKGKRSKISPRRKYKRYTPDQLRWAVNYMRKEKTTAGKAAKAAEKQFDLACDTIPKSTIWHYSHNPNRQIGKRPGVCTVLSDAEEKILAEHVGKSMSMGQVIGKRAIKELATKMLQNAGRHTNVKTKDGVLSNKWYKGFMRRHPHLKRQRGRSSATVSVPPHTPSALAAQAAQASALDLSQHSGNVDTRGVQRGNCTECECAEYERPPDSVTNDCFYCGHKPPSHKNLGSVRMLQKPGEIAEEGGGDVLLGVNSIQEDREEGGGAH